MNPRHKKTSHRFFDIFDRYPREYFVFGFFLIFFFAIVWEAFSYTVIKHDFYTQLAEQQQIGEVEVPVTRWTIYSNTGSGTVLATSVDLNDLAIDPQIEWNKEKLILFLTEILYKEMCYLQSYDTCYSDILRFLKISEIPWFVQQETFIKNKIYSQVRKRLAQDKITSVKIRDGLSPEDEKHILSWGISGVYPSVNGLYVNPEELQQRDMFVEKYVDTFGGDPDDIAHSVRQRDLRYIPILQKLSLLGSDEIEQYIQDEKSALEQEIIEKKDTVGGFIVLTPHQQRIYPERQVSAQIIWFLDNAGEGHYGLEWYFNEILRGNPGEQVRKKDSQGRTIDPITFDTKDFWALEGADIYTTIDRNVQKTVEELLERWVKRYKANQGTIVVIEPKTGKVLSLANYPSFDANSPWEVYELNKVNYEVYPNPETDLLGRTVFVEDVERWDPYFFEGEQIFLREATRKEYGDYEKEKYIYKNSIWSGVYQNGAISSLYEPWSIMKAITVAIGIDTGEILPTDMYNDIGKVTIDNFTIANVDSTCLGYNNFTHALSFSCNVGMIRIVQKIGKALMYKYLVDFGFSEPTGITLDGEVSGKISPYERWPTSKLLTTSYGLGMNATPLQIALAYSAIANGGIYMKPYIIDRITFADGKEITYTPQPIRRVIKQSTSQMVTDMLVTWVNEWVASNGAVPEYSIAGKTGTSQIAYRGGYESGAASTYGSFAGFAPAEDPQFVIVVKLDRPRTSQYGWQTSAYIFSEVATELLKYYKIPKNTDEEK